MQVTELAQAKVNLYLRIFGRRPDGFHQLETVLQTVRLADQLTLTPLSSGIELTCDDPRLSAGADNLAYRAASALAQQFPGPGRGVHIHLQKRIPWQAGLGGGSSDAAAVLRGLNRLWRLDLSLAELSRLAAELGSDVPFFLTGGMAQATGRGEIITPLGRSLSGAVLLVIPPFGLSTPEVYRAWRESSQGGDWLALEQALLAGDSGQCLQLLQNDLEQPAFLLRPELAVVKRRLIAAGLPTLLSGSGSSLFVLASSPEAVEQSLRELLPADYRVLSTDFSPLIPGLAAGEESIDHEI